MDKDKESVKGELNAKQLLFCNYYVSNDTFGNGVQSYCKAYDIDYSDVKTQGQARHSASMLLNNVNICKHINNLLDEAGLNDNFADKRLLFLITQNEDKATCLNAIKEYNKLRARITDKLEVTGTFDISLKLE